MADASPAIRKLTSNDVDAAADVLVRAFFNYPMLTWLMPDDAHRRATLPTFLRASVRWGLLMDEVYGASDPLTGVAIWAPPGLRDADLDPDDSFVHYADVLAALGPGAAARHERFLSEQHTIRDGEIGERTWYLAWLGIDPASQRSGVGGALLRHMFDLLDPEGVDTYLETEKAINVPYYERHAFGVLTQGVISGGGPKFWTMRRTAGAS